MRLFSLLHVGFIGSSLSESVPIFSGFGYSGQVSLVFQEINRDVNFQNVSKSTNGDGNPVDSELGL
jgi:hypothetical protein